MDIDLTYFVDSARAFVLAFGLDLLGAVLVLIGGWVVAGWAKRAIIASLGKTKLDTTLVKFFGSLSAWLIIALTILACLEIFGIKTTSFVALIGAAGLAIGLAFQGTLSSFAAGIMLLVFRPFKVGDAVTVAGVTGKIDEIDLFMTRLDTFDNRRIFIPNNKIFGSNIETITFHPKRRADVSVGTAYDADIDHVREVLEQAAADVPGALADPAPVVFLVDLGASSVDWQVRVWAPTPDFGAVRQATVRAVKKALDDAGISIPFPQMDVHMTRANGASRAEGEARADTSAAGPPLAG